MRAQWWWRQYCSCRSERCICADKFLGALESLYHNGVSGTILKLNILAYAGFGDVSTVHLGSILITLQKRPVVFIGTFHFIPGSLKTGFSLLCAYCKLIIRSSTSLDGDLTYGHYGNVVCTGNIVTVEINVLILISSTVNRVGSEGNILAALLAIIVEEEDVDKLLTA